MKQNYSTQIRGLFMSAFILLTTMVGYAQKSITGKVSDAKGESIPGASVQLKGTKTGTITDVNGDFKLQVANTGTIVISSIGYKPEEIALSGQSTYNVTLQDDASSLEEVVVTGYTVDRRRESTGAIATVKTKDLTRTPSGNVEQQLQGRVAGLTVITNGQPGSSSQIRIRGFGGFIGNEPLYIVDGMPVNNTDFLNPDDIESTTVLKDASAASIYGARAANGVIVYTTKKGTKGAKKLSVTYDGMAGVTDPGTGQDMMNPSDFANWTFKALYNSGAVANDLKLGPNHPQFGNGSTPVIPDYINVGGAAGVTGSVDLEAAKLKYNIDPSAGSIYQVVKANKEGTDWYGAITRRAPIQRHSLGFSGGGENSRFYIGMSVQDQKGILMSNSFKRYALRANSEFNVTKNIRIGQNFQVTYRQVLGQTGGAGGNGIAADENDILQAFRMPSIIPLKDEFGGYASTAAKGFNNPRSPLANQEGLLANRNFNGSGTGNVYLEIDPLPGLTLRSSLGGNYNNGYGWAYSRWQYENSENNSAYGYSEFSGYSLAWTLTNTAAYKKAFGKHNVELLVGQEALNTGAGRSINANGLNPFSTDPNYVTITTLGSRNPPNSNLSKGITFASYFGRAIYNLADKYIVTGVIRQDGSSRFGINNRYGIFPAVSAAWRVSAEPFMKNLPWVQDLKIRGGYGTMGNSNPVDPSNQYSLYATSTSNSGYDITGSNGSVVAGFYRSRIGNPDAKWETNITKNLGIEGSFLKGKLDVIVDLWRRDTKDLLFRLPITAVAGFQAEAPAVNIGNMLNKGIDIQVINRGKINNDLSYDLNITGSFLKNEIIKIADGINYIPNADASLRGIAPIRNQLGYSLSSFYGFNVLGIFQNKAEVDAAPAQDGKGVGRFRYQDINGDGKIDPNDRTFLGSPVPKFTGGLNFGINYKSFDVSAYVYTSIGNKIFNMSKWYTDFYPSFSGAAISERVKNSWSPTNTTATTPIFENVSNFSTNTQANSFYVEDGSYVRLQNVALGYSFPKAMTDKIKVGKVRLYGSINNLATFTKYQGLDPQVGGNADTNFGIDVGNYPMTRSVTVGLNLGF
jgi:TonB-dependent starch-binding outer membrane protein SusC